MQQKYKLFYLCIFLCLSNIILTSCSVSTTSTSTPTGSSIAKLVKVATREAASPDLVKVQNMMKTMSLQQKIGQMIMVEYNTTATLDAHNQPSTSLAFENTDIATLFSQYDVGNFLMQQVNGNTAAPYYNTPNSSKAT